MQKQDKVVHDIQHEYKVGQYTEEDNDMLNIKFLNHKSPDSWQD